MTRLARNFFALALIAASTLCASGKVKVWQGTLELPTYEEGLPDPNPAFDQLASQRFNYPYTLRTNLTDKRTVHQWRAIFLENEYLKCSVLPDLGGHLYTCFDKINGKPMFYANPSIKKANIGYRGAWAAFGIEFNFPVSHNWMSLSPVDFSFGQNADGSASATVGNTDRVYGMQWSVELVLRPKSTVLEERVKLYNRSDVRHRFYWWNNAGVEVWDDSHIQYPMRFTASHGFTEVEPWPVDASGKDLSIIRNQTDGPVSSFVHGSREPFMGVWNPRSDSGTVHYADYDALPAKKIWSWGVDADGLDWRKALSDNDSAYIEVQAGLFRNQETYAFLQPRETIQFSEYWMPVRDIGAISRANLAGVLALKREGRELIVGFNANHPISAAAVSVLAGQKTIWNEHADLKPEQTLTKRVAIPDPAQKYTVEIRDGAGTVLMRQTEDQYDWAAAGEIKVGSQTPYVVPEPDRRTEDDWLQFGKAQELDGKLLAALQTYSGLLKKNPESYAGLKAAGRLSLALLHYEEARAYLEKVCSRNTTDAEAAYYLGLTFDGLDLNEKARNALEVAYRFPEWRGAAALQLAELSAREGNFAQAERYLNDAVQWSADDERASEELVAIKVAQGEKDSQGLAQKRLSLFPLSELLREQVGNPDLRQLANDHSRILNIARAYLRLGLFRKAFEVLSRSYPVPIADEAEPGVGPAADDPMIAYYRAFSLQKLGESAAAEYRTAAGLPTQYVFPSTGEDLAALRAAVKANPGDANAHYFLGTLYFSKGLANEALAEWNEARRLNARVPVLDASLGIALLHTKNDPEAALEAFNEGIKNDPRNEAVYFGADQALSILKKPSSERVRALEQYPEPAKMPTEMVFELALNLAEAGDFERATGLFRNRFFAREEGGTNLREVWIEVQLLRVMDAATHGQCDQAATVAKNMGSPVEGLAFTSDGMEPFLNSARRNYLLGEMYKQCKLPEPSREHFQKAAGKDGVGEIVWAWRAAKGLPGFDASSWTARLEKALRHADKMRETSSGNYARGLLNQALGHEKEAQQDFRNAFLLPDRSLSYHLTSEAMTQ